VLAGLGAPEFLHRGDDLAVSLGRRDELPLGLGPGALRRRRHVFIR
jgi:hypothetical protein